MTPASLIDVANEFAHAEAEVRAIVKALKVARSDKLAAEAVLKNAMIKAGLEEFMLDGYRKVVWLEQPDEVRIFLINKETN